MTVDFATLVAKPAAYMPPIVRRRAKRMASPVCTCTACREERFHLAATLIQGRSA